MAKGPHWELGARIHAARVRRGFTYSQIAAYCGVTEIAVRSWESGKSRLTGERLTKVAEACGVSAPLLAMGGLKWDEALLRVQPLPGPHVFQWPTLFPEETQADGNDGASPFRQAPGVDQELPGGLPRERSRPERSGRDWDTGDRQDNGQRAALRVRRSAFKAAVAMKVHLPRTKVELMPLIAKGECCSLCLTVGRTEHRGGGYFCRVCLDMFDDRRN